MRTLAEVMSGGISQARVTEGQMSGHRGLAQRYQSTLPLFLRDLPLLSNYD